jgi:hypothetical protein
MTAVRLPARAYHLGEHLPPIGMAVKPWAWGSSPSLTAWAQAQLRHPLGTIITDIVDGHPVVAQIQTHSDYGAHPDWAPTPHKGTSVFSPAIADAEGRLVAAMVPPPGWGETTIGADSAMLKTAEAAAWAQEEKARGVAAKLPPGAATVGLAAVGLVAGPPGAILGGIVGLGIDLWSHLWDGPAQKSEEHKEVPPPPKGKTQS